MNPDNVGSLPACQALVKARIMMETEKVWYYDSPSDSWDIISYDDCCEEDNPVPAPLMSELWRELPINTRLQKGDTESWAWIESDEEEVPFHNDNPCDALVALLIWVKGEKK